ncbi:MAG: calcium/sodium antiporter [Bacteroidales bacterium]|nr:calcium/sodium antiporter [Bacteroidales bacterium]
MTIIIPIIKLLGGIVLLLLGGKYLVKGGVEITKYFNISKLVVGMTVVALGTSAPELLVSLQAAIKGSPEIALGNVIGSNIANIALVLAATIIILPMTVKKQTIVIDWPIMAFAFILLIVFMLDDKLSFVEGSIFVVLLIAYVWGEIKYSLNQNKNGNGDEKVEEKKLFSIPVAILVIVVASVGLAYGANFLVDGASELARLINISERVISISIVAIGTSLPELTASIIAATKKETDISVGNIIGSNIFNIFAILGATAMVHPIEFDHKPFMIDLIWMSGIGIAIFLAFLPMKKKFINRSKGVILLVGYLVYMTILFIKG